MDAGASQKEFGSATSQLAELPVVDNLFRQKAGKVEYVQQSRLPQQASG